MRVHIRRRTGRSWANPVKSLRDETHFAPGRRCEMLEVAGHHKCGPTTPGGKIARSNRDIFTHFALSGDLFRHAFEHTPAMRQVKISLNPLSGSETL